MSRTFTVCVRDFVANLSRILSQSRRNGIWALLRCTIISSRRSAATSEIVKHFWATVRSAIASVGLYFLPFLFVWVIEEDDRRVVYCVGYWAINEDDRRVVCCRRMNIQFVWIRLFVSYQSRLGISTHSSRKFSRSNFRFWKLCECISLQCLFMKFSTFLQPLLPLLFNCCFTLY